MIDVVDIRTKLRGELNSPTPTFWTDEELDNYISSAIEMFQSIVFCTYLVMPGVSDIPVSLPDGFLKIKRICDPESNYTIPMTDDNFIISGGNISTVHSCTVDLEVYIASSAQIDVVGKQKYQYTDGFAINDINLVLTYAKRLAYQKGLMNMKMSNYFQQEFMSLSHIRARYYRNKFEGVS